MADKLPQPGDVITKDGYTFRVQSMRGRRVAMLRVTAPEPTEEESPAQDEQPEAPEDSKDKAPEKDEAPTPSAEPAEKSAPAAQLQSHVAKLREKSQHKADSGESRGEEGEQGA